MQLEELERRARADPENRELWLRWSELALRSGWVYQERTLAEWAAFVARYGGQESRDAMDELGLRLAPALIAYMKSSLPHERHRSLSALARCPEALRLYCDAVAERALHDPLRKVASRARRALKSLDPVPDSVFEILTAALGSEDESVRHRAEQAFRDLNSLPHATLEALIAGASSPELVTRVQSFRALGHALLCAAAQGDFESLSQDPNPDTRQRALELVLAFESRPVAYTVLAEALSDPEPRIRSMTYAMLRQQHPYEGPWTALMNRMRTYGEVASIRGALLLQQLAPEAVPAGIARARERREAAPLMGWLPTHPTARAALMELLESALPEERRRRLFEIQANPWMAQHAGPVFEAHDTLYGCFLRWARS